MIKFFVHNEEKVKIEIQTGLPIERRVYIFYWDCGNQAFAYMLSEQFKKHYGDQIEKIRREEYERGHKDGRAKRKKVDWFKRWL